MPSACCLPLALATTLSLALITDHFANSASFPHLSAPTCSHLRTSHCLAFYFSGSHHPTGVPSLCLPTPLASCKCSSALKSWRWVHFLPMSPSGKRNTKLHFQLSFPSLSFIAVKNFQMSLFCFGYRRVCASSSASPWCFSYTDNYILRHRLL